ncbi:hypothetical protein [Luteococcus japonicus]|uniref:hypothetical protein n=1 Tax=Luteococcus japonicus TaxID=33984 RepID=UPI002118A4A5|nr:hypothetical protein [Luteococcus japonicus]
MLPSSQPARSSAFWVAGTGPMPMIGAGTPAAVTCTTRARANRTYFSMAALLATITAEAPS